MANKGGKVNKFGGDNQNNPSFSSGPASPLPLPNRLVIKACGLGGVVANAVYSLQFYQLFENEWIFTVHFELLLLESTLKFFIFVFYSHLFSCFFSVLLQCWQSMVQTQVNPDHGSHQLVKFSLFIFNWDWSAGRPGPRTQRDPCHGCQWLVNGV